MLKQAFQRNSNPKQPIGLSWVYVFVLAGCRELNIGLTFNLSERFSKSDAPEKLIYYRSFSLPFDAVAHKHLLDSLSKESVLHWVKKINPHLNNLILEIFDD
ncbi:MAG: hypothetical protein PHW35_10710 [Lentimicrobiaceae bacterium]|nr:hypothetical protein [Lentimicrobiaceae bacterium]MDD4598426.1 hypothetical protein [Lentimicrobiaceae bacterium]MDY0026950.1 hypothetical protein [Lentimicrobium sp.]